jgi:hypothetical protein
LTRCLLSIASTPILQVSPNGTTNH